MIRLNRYWVAILLFVSISASAQSWQNNVYSSAAVWAAISGNSTTMGMGAGGTLVPVNGISVLGGTVPTTPVNLSGWQTAGNFGVSNAATGVTVGGNASARVGGVSVPVTVSSTAKMGSVAAALGRFVSKVSTPLVVGNAIFDLVKELNFDVVRQPDNSQQWFKKVGGVVCTSDCYEYYANSVSGGGASGWSNYLTPEAACAKASSNYNAISVNGWSASVYTPVTITSCTVKMSSSGSSFTQTVAITRRSIPPYNTASTVPANPQEFIDAIANQSGWPSSSNLAKSVKDAIVSGEKIDVNAPTVTGPATTPGQTSSTTNADGTTTTNTTTNKFNYSGDTITNTTTVVTTNNNPVTNVTTTTTTNTTNPTSEKSEPSDPCLTNPDRVGCAKLGSITDANLPGKPVLYTPKFPNGLSGVWDSRISAIKATPLFSLPANLMPNVASGGTCPVWMLPLNVGIRDFGSYNVAPPCFIWDFGKFVIIVSALFLARRLIFGG